MLNPQSHIDDEIGLERADDRYPARLRSLTDVAMEEFQVRVQRFKSKLYGRWEAVKSKMDQAAKCADTIDALKKSDHELCLSYGEYRLVSRDYAGYLQDMRTKDSISFYDELLKYDKENDIFVKDVLQQIDTRSLNVHEIRSSKSAKSRASNQSSESTRMKAKAEAAKARLVFVQKEAELKRKKALLAERDSWARAKTEREREEIDVDLELIKEEKLCAEAEAEATVYDNLIIKDEWRASRESLKVPEEDPVERTRQYVIENNGSFETYIDQAKDFQSPDRNHSHAHSYSSIGEQPDYTAPPTTTHRPQTPPLDPSSANAMFGDFTNYLLKKDLISSRFTKFTDDPGIYGVWKTSFKNVLSELKATPHEEMALLTNWLGPESSRQAMNMRAANAHNPAGGLKRIWSRLDERYGAPELVESTLRKKIKNFPAISPKDSKRLYDLGDILSEIESVKEDERYKQMLSFYDTSWGVNPIVAKLPSHLQNKWFTRASRYKIENKKLFPPFSYFVRFIQEMSSTLNDPSFDIHATTEEVKPSGTQNKRQDKVFVKKTEVDTERKEVKCPLHESNSHSLNECRNFLRKNIVERRQLLKDYKMCFKCCKSTSHMARKCTATINCNECGSTRHSTALHDPINTSDKPRSPKPQGGEQAEKVTNKCTAICGEGVSGRSCAKTLLVDIYPEGQPGKSITVYAVLDDQSNRTLASSELLDALGIAGDEIRFTISSCAGTYQTSGRRVDGLVVRAMDGSSQHVLPTVIECDIPQDITETATPEVVAHQEHLRVLKDEIPPYRPECFMGLLIGRDVPDVHHVHEQIVGPRGSAFAQKLSLGWVVVGDVCLGKVHPPDSVTVYKTSIVSGRGTIFQPCESYMAVKESQPTDTVFAKTKDDEKVGYSVEDREFINIMKEECHMDDNGFWTAPLPFRNPRLKMPNNRKLAWKRATILDANLKKNTTKCEHFVKFMEKVLDSGAAEVAPPSSGEMWYLPIFGVYHPKKPEKIRGVFDSSAIYQGVSLNSMLMSGPNLTNSLLSILIRFRKDAYAITADIEQMFYRFLVKEEHRDYLRFLWYQNNDPTQELIDYRMKAHVFGNSPSPTVAMFSLCKSAEGADDDVKDFVEHDFYVDDAILSRPTADEAIDLIKRTQKVLRDNGNIRLHKITSNSAEVMNSFPEEDRCQGLKSLDLEEDVLPIQHSLGMSWDLNKDIFKFDVNVIEKTGTRRNMLSALNSIFDPIGFISPVTIHGRILLRELTTGTAWDEIISDEQQERWNAWTSSLQHLGDVQIPRMCVPISLTTAKSVQLHIYSDASEKAIAAVAYVTSKDDNETHTGFVMGKAKLAPSQGHSIPRLELCAAVLAVEVGETLSDALGIPLETIRYHSDSKVVLGYIYNKTRRFYNYVANRVERILQSTRSDQWSYVSTNKNPADQATRTSVTADKLDLSMWLQGPNPVCEDSETEKTLIDPDIDKEVRPEVVITSRKTSVEKNFSERFNKFSSWQRLSSGIAALKRAIRTSPTKPQILCDKIDMLRQSQEFIIGQVQRESYHEEMSCLKDGKPINANSSIRNLNPFLDYKGLLRVGGRLNKAELPVEETNPWILPGKSHVSRLIVLHYHESVCHQGRNITEGALRSNGFWIVGAKRLVSSIIHHCVKCRKLRGSVEIQQMADLPADRLQPGPPFTSVGVDAFGPWSVVTRKTRGGAANSKRWGILFTCLTSRAIHVEVVEEMSSSSFINALRRFVALRGNVREFRSDRGTNFIGATDSLHIDAINVTDSPVNKYLYNSGVVWKFNAPHSSHMGGVWERMIGLVRRILDSMLLGAASKCLTHEVLVTFMAEVCAIVNSRPVGPISTDPESPEILSPAVLLNQKVGQSDQISSVSVCEKDFYKSHCKRVQLLSDVFWKKWHDGYLQSLQQRRKWTNARPNVRVGDVILLKDKGLPRNEWSLGLVQNAIPSECDGKVRKAEVRVVRNGKSTVFVRPITEMVILVENSN
ncbi:uncharacterized protein LOC117341759 [Pecten maximus]|uniref:uncharacterized protein LOC117341759 n=1 Tax=Pecten maximus TaxID=6579 RepID=UPI001458850E|nr:uncharacterized protein LOC117341759 [Pecten maximus]